MEWTGQQQIFFLLQSIGLGAIQGFFLDLITGFSRIPKGRRWLWTDVAFGPLAAVVTFFGALVVMDGQLHPLLLFGVFLGMAAEHILIGVWMCRIIRQTRRAVRKGLRIGCGFFRRIMVGFDNHLRSIRLHKPKTPKKGEK